MAIKKCAACNEDISLKLGCEPSDPKSWVHRYNWSEECLGKSTFLTLPVVDGDGDLSGRAKLEAKAEGKAKMTPAGPLDGKTREEAGDCKNCDKPIYQYKGEYFHQDTSDRKCKGKKGSQAEPKDQHHDDICECGHNWSQHADHMCHVCDCFNAPKKQEKEQPPVDPKDLPQWILDAVTKINDTWRERIRQRGYMLTDMEAAEIVAQHATGKEREADSEAEMNIGQAIMQAAAVAKQLLNNKVPTVIEKDRFSNAVDQTLKCVECGATGSAIRTQICTKTGTFNHKLGVIMPSPKFTPAPEPDKAEDYHVCEKVCQGMGHNYTDMCWCGHTYGQHSGLDCGKCDLTGCFGLFADAIYSFSDSGRNKVAPIKRLREDRNLPLKDAVKIVDRIIEDGTCKHCKKQVYFDGSSLRHIIDAARTCMDANGMPHFAEKA